MVHANLVEQNHQVLSGLPRKFHQIVGSFMNFDNVWKEYLWKSYCSQVHSVKVSDVLLEEKN